MVAIDRSRAGEWKAAGEEKFGPLELHGGRPRNHDWFDYWWPALQDGGGTSAMMAYKIALAMGFDEVILCGCPLQSGPYADGSAGWTDKGESNVAAYYDPWIKVSEQIQGIVFSMSGFTKELLGEPLPNDHQS